MSSSCFCCFCVREMDAGVIESFGKFEKIVPAGLVCICWPFSNMPATVSLKIQHLEVTCDTKTKDNVFVKIVVAVQYKVMEDKVPSAYYKLTDPVAQVRSYVNDVVRSSVPRMNLDESFASKDQIASAVKEQLREQMSEYGYEIIASLVVDIDPNAHLKAAMNDINASQRMREAASFKADAEKILQVKAAEAEAESKYLSGVGVAKQRKAIIDGLRDTVNTFSNDVSGAGPKDVMDLLLLTQYFDMIKEVGTRPKTVANTIFMPHTPQAVSSLRNELTKNFMSKMT